MRSPRILVAWLLLFLVGCASGGLPRKGWNRYRVGEVEFYSGARESQTRELVGAFAKFRAVTGAITTAESVEPRIPARVFLFPDQLSYQQHASMENSGAMFAVQHGEFTIALNANYEGGQGHLFHEYTHLILANTGNQYPTWYDEGFAELMSTMAFVGTDVHVGRVPPDNLLAVAEYNRWVPMAELLRGDVFFARDEVDRLHRHYAQAWLAVHYIQFGSPKYAEKVGDYIQLSAQTGDPHASFEPAFGVSPTALEKELRDYLRGQQIGFRVMPADQFQLPTPTDDVEILTPAATAGALARMCWMLGNDARANELRSAAIDAGEQDPVPALDRRER